MERPFYRMEDKGGEITLNDNMDFKARRVSSAPPGMDIHLSLFGMGLYLSTAQAQRIRDILTEVLEGNN